MSVPRIVIVRTQDHGQIMIPEPHWCTGEHPVEGYRVDITHQGPEVPLNLYSERVQQERQFLTAYLVQRPFTDFPATAVEFGGVDFFEYDSAGLRDVVDALIVYALGHLPALIRQLERIETKGDPA